VEQDWQKIGDPNKDIADLEWAIAEGVESPDVFECVACGKSFKSEAAWESHERSKKHLKAVEMLKREMEEDAEELGLETINLSDDEQEPGDPQHSLPLQDNMQLSQTSNQSSDERQAETEEPASQGEIPSGKARTRVKTTQPREKSFTISNRRAQGRQGGLDPINGELGGRTGSDVINTDDDLNAENHALLPSEPTQKGNDDDDLSRNVELSKREKRRAREAAKKVQKGLNFIVRIVPRKRCNNDTNSDMAGSKRCNHCEQVFETRTKLFAHVRNSGHALAEPEREDNSGRTKGKKGKR
jgi:DnaJ family protein A protein 5